MDSSLKSKFLSGLGWLGLSKIIIQTGTWTATIIIARLLTPADYGLVGMAGLFTGIIMLFGDLGLGASIIQKKKLNINELSSLFYILTGIGFLITMLIFIIAPLGGLFFKEHEVTKLIRLSSITFFINSLSTIPKNLMQKEMKFKNLGIIQAFSALSSSVITILLAWRGYGAYSLMWGTVSNSLITTILSFINQKFIPRFIFSGEIIKDHLRFGGLVTVERYLWWYYTNVDFLLAGKMIGKNDYGFYSMAFSLARMPMEKLASILNPVSFSMFSAIDKRDELIRHYFSILKYMSFLMFPIFCGFYWIADDIFPLLLGLKWNDSIFLFKILSLVCLIQSLSTLNSPIINAMRRPDVGVKNMLLGSFTATIAFLIGINWGIKGLAVSWLIFYPPVFIIYLMNISKVVGFTLTEYFLNISSSFFNIVIMSIFINVYQYAFDHHIYSYFIQGSSLFRLAGTIMVGIVSFMATVFIFDRKMLTGLCGLLKPFNAKS
jgi:O-antigen/teichoic acid export membrane protein